MGAHLKRGTGKIKAVQRTRSPVEYALSRAHEKLLRPRIDKGTKGEHHCASTRYGSISTVRRSAVDK
jgi:hypothetical protein